MRLHLLSSFALVSLAGIIPACGSLSSNTNGDAPLATVVGEVVNPSAIPVDGQVRVAVVWQAPEGEFNVAQDLPVQPVFPSSFTIELDGPPPASAMIDASEAFGSTEPTTATSGVPDGPSDAGLTSNPTGKAGTLKLQGGSATPSSSAQLAFGVVVAYLDKNGNGKLDLVPDGATGYVDQILATNQTELLVYFQGSIPSGAADELGHQPTLGYNLHSGCDVALPASQGPGSLCTPPADAGAPAPTCDDEWLAISTPVTLSVSTDPQVNSLMCETPDDSASGSSSATQMQSGQPAQYPDVCDSNLGCAPDGSSYTYLSCETAQAGLCEGTVTTCTSVEYERPSQVPAGWPCKP